MKRLLITALVISMWVFSGCGVANDSGKQNSEKMTKLKIGWQIPWSLQGQIVQVLKHTDISKNNGIEAEFVGRTYGPELNEAALAG